MDFATYKVTCKKCHDSDTLKITKDNQVFYTNHTPIIAARFRPDMRWGFECMCGNDSRLAVEEKNNLEMLVKGGAHSIAKIAKSLTTNNYDKFRMEPI